MEQPRPTLTPTTQLGPHAVTVGDGAGGTLELTRAPDAYPQARLARAGMTALSVTLDRAKLRTLRDWLTLQLEPEPAPDELPDLVADGYDWPDLEPEGATESVTAEAERHQYGDREDDYGHPRENLTRTAILWTGLLQHHLADGAHIEPADVGRLMLATKLSRDVENPKRDNRVDMAGYALCLDRLETGR